MGIEADVDDIVDVLIEAVLFEGEHRRIFGGCGTEEAVDAGHFFLDSGVEIWDHGDSDDRLADGFGLVVGQLLSRLL
jgi:hypothetical protein